MPACIPVQQTLVHMLDATGLSLRALVQRFKHRAGHLHLAHDLASTRVEGLVGQHPMPQILYSDRGRVCQGPNLFLSSAARSINFVNAAALRPQDSAFVGLSNFPSFDRNHAGKERTHMSFGFF
jgi:hypothetical protein